MPVVIIQEHKDARCWSCIYSEQWSPDNVNIVTTCMQTAYRHKDKNSNTLGIRYARAQEDGLCSKGLWLFETPTQRPTIMDYSDIIDEQYETFEEKEEEVE